MERPTRKRSRRRTSAARSSSCSRVGVDNYVETDVYAAARVFTGWNLRGSDDYRQDEYGDLNAYQEFFYNADQHETTAKTFSFPIYSDGSKTIPGRSGSAKHAGRPRPDHRAGAPSGNGAPAGPEVLELLRQRDQRAGSGVRRRVAAVYLQNGTEIRPVVRYILNSPWFNDPAVRFARYSWPAEYVVRSIREVGWQNFSLDKARGRRCRRWGSSCTSRRTSPDGRKAPTGFRRDRCWRGRISRPTLAASQKPFLAVSLAAGGPVAAGLAGEDAQSRDAGAARLGHRSRR